MKVVINTCFGGFSISSAAICAMIERGNEWAKKEAEKRLPSQSPCDVFFIKCPRHDPDLVAVVEELGDKAAGAGGSQLEIVEIPDGVKYHIHDYDGLECIHEDHRIWHGSLGHHDSCNIHGD